MLKDCAKDISNFKDVCAKFPTTPVGTGCERHKNLGESILRECRIDAGNGLNRGSCDCFFEKVQKHSEMVKDCAKDLRDFTALCAELPAEKKCSDENGLCLCKGYVKYGVENYWSSWKRVDGSIKCNSSVFEDPKKGTWKHCVCQPLPKRAEPYECHRYNHFHQNIFFLQEVQHIEL
jgi:hypothetical protein